MTNLLTHAAQKAVAEAREKLRRARGGEITKRRKVYVKAKAEQLKAERA